MKNIYLFSAFLLYFALANSNAYAQSITSTIYATGTTGSYKTGSVNSSGTKNDGDIVNVSTLSGNNRGWAVFDLSSIPPASVISAATIKFTTYSSTLSSASNKIHGFTGNPATMSGTALYTACETGSPFNSSSWSASAQQVKTLNAAGIAFLNANVANANTVIGFVRGSTNSYNIYGYPATSNGDKPQLEITYIPGTPCAGQPTAGTVNVPTAQVCPMAPFTASLSGMTAAGGITIQWQSRPGTSGPWTNISGATNSSETFTASTNTQYRAYVVCTNSNLADTTAPASVSVATLFPGGTYTIDAGSPSSSTNFQSFTDAVSAIACGIAGPIEFDVVTGSGPYNEQITITDIPTITDVNTVTFNGNGETLTYSSSNSNERAGIKLDGADHITINDLIIEPTGTYGFGIQLINDADSNTINGCTVDNVLTTSSSGLAGIVISGSATSATGTGSDCDGNMISNNTTIGGYYGITCNGTSGSGMIHHNSIINNTVKDFYYYGIRSYGNDYLLVANNDISRPTRTSVSTFYGIYLSTYHTNARVAKNYVHDPMGGAPTSTSSNYGIMISGADATSGNENLVTNNLITFENGNGTQYALYNSSSNYALYYHNTISLENTASTSGNTRGLYQTSTASGIEFKNNIISITRGGSTAKYGIYKNTAGSSITSDNNVFYINSANTSTNNIGYQSGAKTTLAAWQSATSGDANTVTSNPQFTAPTTGDYKPTNNTISNIGVGIADVPYDILGYPRNGTTPDPGAYEMVPPCDTPSGLSVINLIYTGATLNWTPVPGAAGYQYALTMMATPPLTGTSITGNSHNATNLTPNTDYYFHLRTECSPGAYSPWITISFHTPVVPACIPTIPTISNITANTADISWTTVAGANGYEYDVSTSPTPPASGTATTATTYNATGLPGGTLHYVHVRSNCGSNGFSSWVSQSFTTSFPPCLPPTVTISNVTTGSADIDWPVIGTAVEYEYAVTSNNTPPASGITTVSNSHTIGGLYDDHQYYVHIRTDCGQGGTSPWTTSTFTTEAYCTAPTAIISNVTDTRADINWNAMSGSNSYEYAISTSIAPPSSGTSTTGLNYNADQLNPGTQYYIHLRSVCDNNEFSNWSTSGFTTRYPTSVSNINVITGIDVYPNPITNVLHVRLNGVITGSAAITLTDVTGKIVKHTVVTDNETDVNTGDLAPGIYLLKYADDTYSEIVRVVKQ